jgi:hypothetical protein
VLVKHNERMLMSFTNTAGDGAGPKRTARKVKRAAGVVALSAALLGAMPLASAQASTTDATASTVKASAPVSQAARSVAVMTVHTNHVAFYNRIGETNPAGYVDNGQKANVVCVLAGSPSSVVVDFWGGRTNVNLPIADYLSFTGTGPSC